MQSGSVSTFGHYLREKWLSPRKIRFWLLIFLIINVLLGFFAVPPVVEHYAKKIAEEDFDRELRIETVRTNPFNLTLRMDALSLRDTDSAPLLDIEQIHIDIAWSSLFSSGWTVNSIRIESPVVHEERFASGETRLMRLVQDLADEDTSEDEQDSSELVFGIKFFHIEDGELRFTDNLANNTDDEASEQVDLVLEQVEFIVEDLSFNEDSNASIQLDGELAAGGELSFDGELALQPNLTLQGDVGINQITLTQVASYLQHFLGLQLESGLLSVNGTIYLNDQQPLAFQGDARLDELRISQTPEDEALLGWQSLHSDHIDLDVTASELDIGVINLEGLIGQIVINEDQTTNFGELFETPPAAEDGDADEPADNANEETVAVDTDSDEPAQTAEGSNQLAPFSVTIEGVVLSDGAVDFTDDSLPLPFSTNIHSLEGEVSTISSTSAEPARLELEGQVEDYGLATAEGTLQTFDPTAQTEIRVSFRNLEIPQYSAYTADLAGRTIAGGTMDLDLTYTIDNKQLEGSNNLIIRNIELGESVDTEDAMDLPLRLAIALLEDSDGVIDLTLPVEGDVDDPEFDVGAIVREALSRAFTNVVEAPFRLLADAIGSDSEDLGRIEFAAGRSDLSPPQLERIAELQEALNSRPGVVIELAGPYNREFDGAAIKQDQAEQALREHLADAGRNEDELSLTSEDNQDAIEALFAEFYPESDLESVRERFTEPQTDGADFDDLAYRNYLAEQVIAIQSVSNEELEALGNARASAVRDALLADNTDIGEERIQVNTATALDSVDSELITLDIQVTNE